MAARRSVRGDPAVDEEAVREFDGLLDQATALRKSLKKKKRNLDAETVFDCRQRLELAEAELCVIRAHLTETERVRTLNQPTMRAGGRRRRSKAR